MEKPKPKMKQRKYNERLIDNIILCLIIAVFGITGSFMLFQGSSNDTYTFFGGFFFFLSGLALATYWL